MKKIWIVLKSEYIRRVRSVWFIVGTLIAPVLLIALSTLPAILGAAAVGSDEKTIAVIDETGVLFDEFKNRVSSDLTLIESSAPQEDLRTEVLEGSLDGYLLIPASMVDATGEAMFYSVEGGGLTGASRLESSLSRALEEHRLDALDVSDEVRTIIDARVSLQSIKLTEEGEEADSAAFYSILGYIMGFIIYMAMFLYGAYVIQGVLEEKTTRVIEVMVSSVRPFQMLMGKVLGIGAVGFTQIIVWSGIMLGITFSAGTLISFFMSPEDLNLPVEASQEEILAAMDITIPSIDPSVFIWFVLFFVGGYLLYASLFAAVSSLVEQQQDAQGLLTPIYLLIIIPIMFIVFFVESPNSPLATGLSMVPFFSPILMVVRVAVTEVPLWQVLLSYALLIGTFLGAMWVSSRIYRIGILMYGKKPGIRDLVRWLRQA